MSKGPRFIWFNWIKNSEIKNFEFDDRYEVLSKFTGFKSLGKGIGLDSNFTLSDNSFKGKFTVNNPNFNNSDKSIYVSAEAIETDNYKKFGYKSNKTGFSFGTNFEYKNDLFLGLGTSNFYEKIETNNTASKKQQDQEGDYWDSFLNIDFDYDKRNQKFQTSSGFRSFYSLDIPVISETATLKNYYNNTYYFDLFDKNISFHH